MGCGGAGAMVSNCDDVRSTAWESFHNGQGCQNSCGGPGTGKGLRAETVGTWDQVIDGATLLVGIC